MRESGSLFDLYNDDTNENSWSAHRVKTPATQGNGHGRLSRKNGVLHQDDNLDQDKGTNKDKDEDIADSASRHSPNESHPASCVDVEIGAGSASASVFDAVCHATTSAPEGPDSFRTRDSATGQEFAVIMSRQSSLPIHACYCLIPLLSLPSHLLQFFHCRYHPSMQRS